ncbi:hypothetical protein P9112_012534 [Eukaryota sp. TZLM1-RC]
MNTKDKTQRVPKPPSLAALKRDVTKCLPLVNISFLPTDGIDTSVFNPFFEYLSAQNLNYNQHCSFYYPSILLSFEPNKLTSFNLEFPSPLVVIYLSQTALNSLLDSYTDSTLPDLMNFVTTNFPSTTARFVSFSSDSHPLLSSFQSRLIFFNSTLCVFHNTSTLNDWLASTLRVYSQSAFRKEVANNCSDEVGCNSLKKVDKFFPSNSAKDTFARMLIRIPRMNHEAIVSIIDHYGSLGELILAYQVCEDLSERQNLLKDLSAGNRRIGPSLSLKVWEIIYGE